MSKASDFAKLKSSLNISLDTECDEVSAFITGEGRLKFNSCLIDAEDIPKLIQWLKDMFE